MPKPDERWKSLMTDLGKHCGPLPLLEPSKPEPWVIEMGTTTIRSGMCVTLCANPQPFPYLPMFVTGDPDHPRKDLWASSLRVGHIDLLYSAVRLTTIIGPTPAALAHLAKEMAHTLDLSAENALIDLQKRHGPMRLDTENTPIAYPSMGTTIVLDNRRGVRATPVTLRLTLHAIALTGPAQGIEYKP